MKGIILVFLLFNSTSVFAENCRFEQYIDKELNESCYIKDAIDFKFQKVTMRSKEKIRINPNSTWTFNNGTCKLNSKDFINPRKLEFRTLNIINYSVVSITNGWNVIDLLFNHDDPTFYTLRVSYRVNDDGVKDLTLSELKEVCPDFIFEFAEYTEMEEASLKNIEKQNKSFL